jgi:D-alanyl-lipoteichoic acid acyltransferase DltB (MBOAT superfamily)
LLLAASLLFLLTWNYWSVVSLLLLSAVNFIAARYLQSAYGKWLQVAVILFNSLAILLVNLLTAGYHDHRLTQVAFETMPLLVAIGLSFYSLQHIAYLVDVRNNRVEAEKDFGEFLLITSYFPKVLAGPLMLYQDMKIQLHYRPASAQQLVSGFNRVLLGFFRKMVLADRLAPAVSSIFDYNDDLPGLTLFFGAIIFTFQLYLDFSGYCDIAIGVSRMFGIDLRENFYFPFRSTSVTIFWRRWHRSLIRFFTSYIFFPITFRYRRFEQHAAAIGIAVTFIISGLWHGIGFTFMMWALCHMLYLLAELYLLGSPGDRQTSRKPLKLLYSFLVLIAVSFSHLFFRSTGYHQCIVLLKKVFTPASFLPREWAAGFFAPVAVGGHQADYFNLAVTFILGALFLFAERRIMQRFNEPAFRPWLVALTLTLVMLFGVFGSSERFIYMQF